MAGDEKLPFRPPTTENARDGQLAADRLNKKIEGVLAKSEETAGQVGNDVSALATAVGIEIAGLEPGEVVYDLTGLQETIDVINGTLTTHTNQISSLQSQLSNKVTKATVANASTTGVATVVHLFNPATATAITEIVWNTIIQPTIENHRTRYNPDIANLTAKVNEIAAKLGL